ncbi:MAG: alpha/beta hydrolase [Bacteroidota bacterium]
MTDTKIPNSAGNTLPHIYTISGMGMNEKLFRKLDFPFPSTHLPWIEPKKGESLRDYSKRIGSIIPENQPVILIGLSFGGVVALEMAEWLNPEKVVLISTIKTRKERPFFFRFMEYIPLYLFQNRALQNATIGLWGPFFGINNKADIRRVMGLFCDLSNDYFRWAIGQMVKLKRSSWKVDIVHIHGTKDRVFPSKYLQDAHLIEGGGHAMIIRESEAIAKIISRFLTPELAME